MYSDQKFPLPKSDESDPIDHSDFTPKNTDDTGLPGMVMGALLLIVIVVAIGYGTCSPESGPSSDPMRPTKTAPPPGK